MERQFHIKNKGGIVYRKIKLWKFLGAATHPSPHSTLFPSLLHFPFTFPTFHYPSLPFLHTLPYPFPIHLFPLYSHYYLPLPHLSIPIYTYLHLAHTFIYNSYPFHTKSNISYLILNYTHLFSITNSLTTSRLHSTHSLNY